MTKTYIARGTRSRTIQAMFETKVAAEYYVRCRNERVTAARRRGQRGMSCPEKVRLEEHESE